MVVCIRTSTKRETYWWIIPYVNASLLCRVLADEAHEFELGAKKHILLAVDQAGWHISKDLKVPEGLHLTLLPSHSPELQPAERLWTMVDEPRCSTRRFRGESSPRNTPPAVAQQVASGGFANRKSLIWNTWWFGGSFISSLPIFTSTGRFDSRLNRFSLVDSNRCLILSD